VLGDAQPFTVAGRDFIVQVSVGIAMANQYDTRSEKLLQDADVACTRQGRRRQRYTFFEPRLGKAYVDRLGLQRAFHGLDNGELFIEYQPVVELSQGVPSASRLCCGGVIPSRSTRTVDFLQVSDNSAIAVEIGAWVLGEAMQQLRGWRNGSRRRLTCGQRSMSRRGSSPAAISSAPFPKAIDASGLEPESLHIELTESAVTDSSNGPCSS